MCPDFQILDGRQASTNVTYAKSFREEIVPKACNDNTQGVVEKQHKSYGKTHE